MTEFVDRVYEDLPLIANYKMGEQLVPAITRIGQDLAESGSTMEVTRVQRRFYPIDREAVMIALRQAHEENKLDLDEFDGIVYPPRQQGFTQQQRYRYM